mmetsp:Transcript_35676/g.83493  ORF Transcript_35676/g.83493 Transcript_35676/m.83493 type:complete len:235 (-) Transcript_35676:2239-2943(-)
MTSDTEMLSPTKSSGPKVVGFNVVAFVRVVLDVLVVLLVDMLDLDVELVDVLLVVGLLLVEVAVDVVKLVLCPVLVDVLLRLLVEVTLEAEVEVLLVLWRLVPGEVLLDDDVMLVVVKGDVALELVEVDDSGLKEVLVLDVVMTFVLLEPVLVVEEVLVEVVLMVPLVDVLVDVVVWVFDVDVELVLPKEVALVPGVFVDTDVEELEEVLVEMLDLVEMDVLVVVDCVVANEAT